MEGFSIALRMLRRDWRGGELGVLIAALVIAVAIVSGVNSFTERLQASLKQESHQFLAADIVLTSPRPVPKEWLFYAEKLGVQQAETLTFPTMVFSAEKMYLAGVKAVSENYPLRGKLKMSAKAYGQPIEVVTGPKPGKVWLDSRLFSLLDVEVGEQLIVGEASLTITAAIRSEPDRGASFLGYGPRVLMHIDDIIETEIVQPGSRVQYRFLFSGSDDILQNYSSWLEPRLDHVQKIVDVSDGQPGISKSLDRAEAFLLLAGSLGVVLAGVAIALAARRFSQRHYDYVAVMKSLGASIAQINFLYGFSFIILGLVGTFLGWFLGWGIQQLVYRIFDGLIPTVDIANSYRPYLIGGVTGFVCLFAFAWPPLRRLAHVSPLRVLRRDVDPGGLSQSWDYLLGIVAIMGLMFWYSGDIKLTLAVQAGVLFAVALVAFVAFIFLRGGRTMGTHAGSVWRLAIAGLLRRGKENALQAGVFSLAIMLLLILILVRTSLIEEWRVQLPENTPNHFILNVPTHQQSAVATLIDEYNIVREPLYPMVRGRVSLIDGESTANRIDIEGDYLDREINLSWSENLPEDNEILEGQWWEPNTKLALVSLEQSIAERLGVSVGGQLVFEIGPDRLEVEVANIRKLDWNSMKPNFFMVFNPNTISSFPATYMTSFYLASENKNFLNSFLREFPTITVIEMDVVINQIKSIIDQVTQAVEIVLLLILIAGGLVLVAGLQSSLDQRLQENAIIRALGGRNSLIVGSLIIEFCSLGLLAGVLATLGAELSVYFLQTLVLDIDYVTHRLLWLLGPLVGVFIVGGLGVWGCRKTVSSAPMRVLREL